jgi:hypothetical protein
MHRSMRDWKLTAQAPRSVENLDDSPMKLIRIENKD